MICFMRSSICVSLLRGMRGKVDSMSMLDGKGDIRPRVVEARSGLVADGPDWDAGLDCSVEPSMTKQSFADECDINKIMERYEKTGVMSEGRRMYEFGEAISEYSYQESLNAVLFADEQFSNLPARVRDRFGNDPVQLLKFLEDPKNRDEAIELGLVDRPPPAAEPMEVRIVDPAPPQPNAPVGASGGPGGTPA